MLMMILFTRFGLQVLLSPRPRRKTVDTTAAATSPWRRA